MMSCPESLHIKAISKLPSRCHFDCIKCFKTVNHFQHNCPIWFTASESFISPITTLNCTLGVQGLRTEAVHISALPAASSHPSLLVFLQVDSTYSREQYQLSLTKHSQDQQCQITIYYQKEIHLSLLYMFSLKKSTLRAKSPPKGKTPLSLYRIWSLPPEPLYLTTWTAPGRVWRFPDWQGKREHNREDKGSTISTQ